MIPPAHGCAPDSLSERVLMVSVGLSPQVVTETIHALHQAGEPLPDRLILLTTRRGAELIRSHLTHPSEGRLVTWGREWGAEAPARALAEGAGVVVIDSDSGDMESPRALAALLMAAGERIRQVTARPDTQLHLSIAGGRKSAAAVLSILMSLHARPGDRISHVLVTPEEAAGSDFFFPTRRPGRLYLPGGRTLDPSQVRVRLVDLPLAGGTRGAARLEDWAAEVLARPRLVIQVLRGRVIWDGLAHDWPPIPTAVVAMLADDLLSGGTGIERARAPAAGFLKYYRRHPRARNLALRPNELIEPEWLEEKISRLNKLAQDCGIRPGGGKLVHRAGERARARYCLALEPGQVALG